MIRKFIFIVCLFSFGFVSAQDYTQAQDRIKSIYTLNILKDIQWENYITANEIRVCVLGRTELFTEFSKINSRAVNGRAISVQKVSSLSKCDECDLIFVEELTAAEKKRVDLCSSLIITFGFYQKDISNVVLMFQDEKLQFSINQDLCAKQGYKVSARLKVLSNTELLK